MKFFAKSTFDVGIENIIHKRCYATFYLDLLGGIDHKHKKMFLKKAKSGVSQSQMYASIVWH